MTYQHYKKHGETYALILSEKPSVTRIRALLFSSICLLIVLLIGFLLYILLYPHELQSLKKALLFLSLFTTSVSVLFILNQPARIEIQPDVDRFFVKVRIETTCFRFAYFQHFKKEGQKLFICFLDRDEKLIHILLGEGEDCFLQSLQQETLSILQS